PLALGGIADDHRHDMAGIVQMRNAVGVEQPAELLDPVLVPDALERARLQMLDRRNRTGGQRWRQGRSEYEARGKRADEITERGGCCDIAAHHAEGFAERTLDDRQAIHETFAFGNTPTARAVHANRVDFV